MNKIIIALCFLLCACGDNIPAAMTNDQIIAEVKKCKEAGMGVITLGLSEYGAIRRVQCRPK